MLLAIATLFVGAGVVAVEEAPSSGPGFCETCEAIIAIVIESFHDGTISTPAEVHQIFVNECARAYPTDASSRQYCQ